MTDDTVRRMEKRFRDEKFNPRSLKVGDTTVYRDATTDVHVTRPRFKPSVGGKWIHDARAYAMQGAEGLNGWSANQTDSPADSMRSSRGLLKILDDPETKRIVIEAQQAEALTLGTQLPERVKPGDPLLRFPFARMWIEFSEPIKIGEDDPSPVRVTSDGKRTVTPGRPSGFDDHVVGLALSSLSNGLIWEAQFIVRSPFGEEEVSWADRSFGIDALEGECLTRYGWLIDDAIWPDDISEHVEGVTLMTPGKDPSARSHRDEPELQDLAFARYNDDTGRRGYWERTVADYGLFIAWLGRYLTAKGIVIVEEGGHQMTRQQRRAATRRKPEHAPQPFHIVRVRPTHVDDDAPEVGGREHAYRYDVRGHWAIGRYWTGPRDGKRKLIEKLTWKPPHQRGLKNARYIPSTHTYDAKSPGVDLTTEFEEDPDGERRDDTESRDD